MKKYLIPVLLLSLAAVSCQREKSVDPKEAVEITVTAGVPETRTYIENGGTAWIPYWNAGDVLGVMVDEDYGSNVSLTNTAEPGRTGSFSGTLKEGVTDGEHTLTAWYPKALRVGRAESVLKYLLAEEQTLPSLTSFDPEMDLLVGMPATFVVTDRKANVDNMRFRRVFTVVKVTLKDESTLLAGKKVSRVALTASGANLAGRVNVEITTGEITRWEDPATTVAGNYAGSDFTIDGAHSAFLLVNPATLAAGSVLTVDVTTDDDNLLITKSVNLPSEVVFAENKVTTLNFTLTDDNVKDKSGAISYTWDFSTAEWQAALAEQAPEACLDNNDNTNVANWSVSLDGLTYTSGSKNGKWGKAGYIQPNGAGSVSERVFSFTAPVDGFLKVTVSNTGDSEATTRLVTVNTGGSESSQVGGVPSKTPTTLTFEVKEGAVKVYPTGGGLRFYKLAFTTEGGSGGDPDQPVEPGTIAELECPDPPLTGTVPLDKLYGYATGVTGGDAATSANILHFDNGKALQTWLLARTKSEKAGDHSPVTIWLSGTFGPEDGRDFSEAHPWFDVKDVSNLSFYGTDSFVMDRIGIFCVRASNIIIRNINFRQPKANNGADAVSMQECDGVWVDHCTFTSLNQTKDYEDGSTDITHGSKNVTVSWNHYVLTQKSCLVGHSNSQSSDTEITATFHHNWFDQSSSRHPRVRFGKVHVYNNLFDGNTTYGVGSAYGAKVLVEYNYFDGVQLPTDICTYPAKESNESNLQGSVAGYLYATQDVFVNRPAKAKDPYPLTNVKYKSYQGETITPLTYADFKPAYDYIVTPAESVPEVVKGGAGYGKLGWTEAPVAVNNGGITEFDGTDPDNPDNPGGDDPDNPGGGDNPGGDTGAHTYTLYMNDSGVPVATVDGTTGSTYFDYSTNKADFRSPSTSSYNGPFTINGTTYNYGFKMDSGGYVKFTTSSDCMSTLRFYYARRKEGDSAACMQLIPTGGTPTVFDTTPFTTFADSGVLELAKGTEYTIKQSTKEQAVILVVVTETE